jgi:hypothetical protein
MKIFIITVLLTINLFAGNPITISTFNSVSVYWSPEEGADSLSVFIKFKEKGTNKWHNGYPMRYNPIVDTDEDLADYRGSIVNLKSNTLYEIELTLEGSSVKDTITAKTWREEFPIAETVYLTDREIQYTVYNSGTPDGYILIEGSGKTIDVKNKFKYCINVYGNYVIIRGLKLINAQKCGINLNNVHDVIIENCDISGWGEEDKNSGFGKNYQSGIYSESPELKRIIVQRCRIHHPRWGANSWAELNASGKSKHPSGPQAISFFNSAGNHVIRYNEFYTDYDHTFNDIIGYGSNGSYYGFPGADSDIYGNYFSHCYDDGIEAEGGNRNTRIWGNYIENVFQAIGNAPTSIGPLYIWKNVSGKAYSKPQSKYGEYAAFIKMGYAKSRNWMTGHMYIFNNTILQPGGKGTGGLGTSRNGASNRIIQHCLTRNNIFHVRDKNNSIAVRNGNVDNDYDYDLCSGGYPEGYEIHGIKDVPTYINEATFDSVHMTANFFLKENTSGYDAGEIIPNFSDNYQGNAPDMGAFESGTAPLEYGVNAYLVTSADENNLANLTTPDKYYLFQNYPNPFNSTTILHFIIPNPDYVKVTVYDISGKIITTLVNDFYKKGGYDLFWNAKDDRNNSVSSGVYFAELETQNFSRSIKMLLIK